MIFKKFRFYVYMDFKKNLDLKKKTPDLILTQILLRWILKYFFYLNHKLLHLIANIIYTLLHYL